MTETMSVFRIEKRGRGPFRYKCQKWADNKYTAVNGRMPAPYNDEKFWQTFKSNFPFECAHDDLSKWRFAAKSLKEVCYWILNPKILDEYGFVIVEYSAKTSNAIIGDYQVAFQKRTAKKVRELNPIEVVDQFGYGG